MHGLQPGGIIHMRYGWNYRARYIELVDAKQLILLFRHLLAVHIKDVCNHQHIGAVTLEIEPLRDIFCKD